MTFVYFNGLFFFSRPGPKISLERPCGHCSLENRFAYDTDIFVDEKLLMFEVVSFSSFLFLFLLAQGLKLALNLLNSSDGNKAFRGTLT